VVAARRESTCILYHERGSIKSYPRAGVATVAILPDRDNWVTHFNGWYNNDGAEKIKKIYAEAAGDRRSEIQEVSRRSDHAMKRNSSGERLPTVCFVVTAKHLGLYGDMAAVAALSVRRLHPHARIVLVTNESTAHVIDRCP